jgi:hypothetical protein
MTKRELIAMQHVNKAAKGDLRAIDLLIKAFGTGEPQHADSLSPILQAMRSIHAKHEAHRLRSGPPVERPGSAGNAKSDEMDSVDDKS